MIKSGDMVKIVKINGNTNHDLVGSIGVVLGEGHPGAYKYRVETEGLVYGFQENEIEKIDYLGSSNNITIRDIAVDIAKLVEKKNHDYDNSFDKTLSEYGPTAYFLRIEDKLSRLKSLTSGAEARIKDEAIEDTLTDIVGYTLLMLKNRLN